MESDPRFCLCCCQINIGVRHNSTKSIAGALRRIENRSVMMTRRIRNRVLWFVLVQRDVWERGYYLSSGWCFPLRLKVTTGWPSYCGNIIMINLVCHAMTVIGPILCTLLWEPGSSTRRIATRRPAGWKCVGNHDGCTRNWVFSCGKCLFNTTSFWLRAGNV